MSSVELDRLIKRARFVAAVEEGLEDERAGRIVSHADVVAEMKRRAVSRKSAR